MAAARRRLVFALGVLALGLLPSGSTVVPDQVETVRHLKSAIVDQIQQAALQLDDLLPPPLEHPSDEEDGDEMYKDASGKLQLLRPKMAGSVDFTVEASQGSYRCTCSVVRSVVRPTVDVGGANATSRASHTSAADAYAARGRKREERQKRGEARAMATQAPPPAAPTPVPPPPPGYERTSFGTLMPKPSPTPVPTPTPAPTPTPDPIAPSSGWRCCRRSARSSAQMDALRREMEQNRALMLRQAEDAKREKEALLAEEAREHELRITAEKKAKQLAEDNADFVAAMQEAKQRKKAHEQEHRVRYEHGKHDVTTAMACSDECQRGSCAGVMERSVTEYNRCITECNAECFGKKVPLTPQGSGGKY